MWVICSALNDLCIFILSGYRIEDALSFFSEQCESLINKVLYKWLQCLAWFLLMCNGNCKFI